MNTLRFVLPPEFNINLDTVRQFLLQLEELGLLYHIDDDPFEVITNPQGDRLFTDSECYALIGFWDIVQARLSWDDVWEKAFPETDKED